MRSFPNSTPKTWRAQCWKEKKPETRNPCRQREEMTMRQGSAGRTVARRDDLVPFNCITQFLPALTVKQCGSAVVLCNKTAGISGFPLFSVSREWYYARR